MCFGKFYSAIQSSSPLLPPPSLCGWSSSLHSAEMPATGAKFNSKSKHKQRLRIKTPLRFTQLQFYQFPPGKDFPLKLLCIQVHSGMQVWVFGVGQFTYRMIEWTCFVPHPLLTLCVQGLWQCIVKSVLEGMAGKHFCSCASKLKFKRQIKNIELTQML